MLRFSRKAKGICVNCSSYNIPPTVKLMHVEYILRDSPSTQDDE